MNNIFDLINKSNSIVILTHETPDGDAIGSALAIYNYLSSINKSVDIVIPIYPKVFNILPLINNIVDNTSKKYDLGIIVDTSTKERIGQNNDVFNNCNKTIVIDHHISNSMYGDINYVEGNASSCSQVIYYLLKNNNIPISLDIGACLMCGLLTDTDGFKHNDVNEETFMMAADLKKLGVDTFKLYKVLLATKSISQYELSKIVMDRLEFFFDKKIVFSYITEKDMKDVNAKLGDHEGLVEIGRDIEGVEVSIFMREENNEYRLSLRSNGLVDVNEIVKIFNGGGHKMAAGAKSSLNFKETKELVINETIRSLSNGK